MHTALKKMYLDCICFLFNFTLNPSTALAHLSSCPSSLGRLTRHDPPSHLSFVCSRSPKGVSDTICFLSVCHRPNTNRCLCQRGGRPCQQVHICQTCVPLAQFSCQVLITYDISHLLHGGWIAWIITTIVMLPRRHGSCTLKVLTSQLGSKSSSV